MANPKFRSTETITVTATTGQKVREAINTSAADLLKYTVQAGQQAKITCSVEVVLEDV